MIDLHTHTTASDGRLPPEELVARAAAAGVTALSVTDHDTAAACETAARACAALGLEFVPGIEISAVQDEIDVHVLGYFIDAESPALRSFLTLQRMRRLERVRRMIDRLAEHGVALDADAILRDATSRPACAIGRPRIARALVDAGYVADSREAFDRWLSPGRPAFIQRMAPRPDEAIARIHEARGVASLAHPGLLERDHWIPAFVSAGLDAIEAYHSEQDARQTARYLDLAQRLGVALSGGSDYHADAAYGAAAPGAVSLPREAFDQLKLRLARA